MRGMRFSSCLIEEHLLCAHGDCVDVLNPHGNIIDVFRYDSLIQTLHAVVVHSLSSMTKAYVGLENGQISLIQKKHPSRERGNNSQNQKSRKLEVLFQRSGENQYESLVLCRCNGKIHAITSSSEYLAVIIHPNQILLLRLNDHSFKLYSSSASSSSSFHSLCFLSQKISHEQQIIEKLHIDLSFGIDNFLLIGTHCGTLEYLRLVPDDLNSFIPLQSDITNTPTDHSTLISLPPVLSLSPSPIVSIFVDTSLYTPAQLPIPQISSNYRTPLLCLFNSDGYLLIYQSQDSMIPYLDKHFRLSLVGSCIWKYPQLPSSYDMALVTYWNGLIFTLHSGSLFAYSINFNALVQSYFLGPPIRISPSNSQYISSFSISPPNPTFPSLQSSPAPQSLIIHSLSQSTSSLPLQPLLSSLKEDISKSSSSPSSSSQPFPLTQNEIHNYLLQKEIRYLSHSLLHPLYPQSSLHPQDHHLSEEHPHTTASTPSLPELTATPKTDEVRELLTEISNCMAIESELQSLAQEIDKDLMRFLSLIQLLQSVPPPSSSSRDSRTIPGLEYRLSFEEYSQHDISSLRCASSENDNTSVFLGLFTLQTSSELVLKAFQGKSIQLTWSEQENSSASKDKDPILSHSWSFQISFQQQKKSYGQ
jgi:hypothetical protein